MLDIRDITLGDRRTRLLELVRPERRNCLSRALLRRLIEAISGAAGSSIVLCGRGSAFCAGLDLREVHEARSAGEHLALLIDLLVTLAAHPQPTVSVVNGPAYGGGVGLAFCTDATVAQPRAKFVLPAEPDYRPLVDVLILVIAARRPVGPELVQSWIGPEMTAATAERRGLVHRVVEGDSREAVASLLGRMESTPFPRRRRGLDADVRQELDRLLKAAVAPSAGARLIARLSERYAGTS